jgi:hypothetical protein
MAAQPARIPSPGRLSRKRSSYQSSSGTTTSPGPNLSRIIDRVEHGEEIIISRTGTPVAKVCR